MTDATLPSKISLIVLGVTDVARSAGFYRNNMGLEVTGQTEGLAFVTTSGVMLMLSKDLGKAFKPIAGATEIVFPVDSVTASYETLGVRGCTFINRPHQVAPGMWAATFTDLDEHKLTLFGPQ
jgi:catechol 2,3-dioxygenase-like lactoylglutathione lyase family enzyme